MIESQKLLSDKISHGFFGRKFGRSKGLHSSLNCSKFVGDNKENVLQNLDVVKSALKASKIITLNQIHSNACIEVDRQTECDIKADAMVTKYPDIAIGVLTADCAPILLADTKNKIVGAIHAGWKGAVFGIADSTIQRMLDLGGELSEIKSAIGPCISKNSYEVGDEFKREFNGNDDCFYIMNSKIHFDLSKYCHKQLIECGIPESNIEILGTDTYEDQENYFSYRFASKNTDGICGRQISAICIR